MHTISKIIFNNYNLLICVCVYFRTTYQIPCNYVQLKNHDPHTNTTEAIEYLGRFSVTTSTINSIWSYILNKKNESILKAIELVNYYQKLIKMILKMKKIPTWFLHKHTHSFVFYYIKNLSDSIIAGFITISKFSSGSSNSTI